MRSEKQILRKYEMSSIKNKISHKANLASAETVRVEVDNGTAPPNLGLWDLDKKKEQFLTIDRF